MHLRLIALVSAAASAAAATTRLDAVTLPQCSLSCVTAQAQHIGCGALDLGCLCDPLKNFYDTEFVGCLKDQCSSSDSLRFDNAWSNACQALFTATNTFINPSAANPSTFSAPSISYPSGSELSGGSAASTTAKPIATTSAAVTDTNTKGGGGSGSGSSGSITSPSTTGFPFNTASNVFPTYTPITTPTFGFGSSPTSPEGHGSTSDPPSSSPPSSGPQQRRRNSSKLSPGAIAGIVIGALAALSGAVTSLFLWIRKHRSDASSSGGGGVEANGSEDEFTKSELDGNGNGMGVRAGNTVVQNPQVRDGGGGGAERDSEHEGNNNTNNNITIARPRPVEMMDQIRPIQSHQFPPELAHTGLPPAELPPASAYPHYPSQGGSGGGGSGSSHVELSASHQPRENNLSELAGTYPGQALPQTQIQTNSHTTHNQSQSQMHTHHTYTTSTSNSGAMSAHQQAPPPPPPHTHT
ncbi:hypothetical protein F5Y17DRAFT_444975 [Xylariaceae sp. FL0594]|nr:hypothetical protein F5Y17DRAFT_444975 [Xylariaceae sp. FL0594]